MSDSFAKMREERAKIRAQFRRKKLREKALVTGIAVVIATALFVGLVALSAVLTKFAWNVGVREVVDASGGHVAKIGFWTALAFNVAWGIVTRPFKRPTVSTTNNTA